MKGAIGNAFILNMVITFILIFYLLLIGSMAYSKAYKTKNYLINLIEQSEETQNPDIETEANEYLGRIGYPINSKITNTCPDTIKEEYSLYQGNANGKYDYCIYLKTHIYFSDGHQIIKTRYNYLVQVYMKFDIPVIGQFIKIPITGETKTYTTMR